MCRYVYCTQHMDFHDSEWCTVPDRDKVQLSATNDKEAVAECRARGLVLYVDVRGRNEG